MRIHSWSGLHSDVQHMYKNWASSFTLHCPHRNSPITIQYNWTLLDLIYLLNTVINSLLKSIGKNINTNVVWSFYVANIIIKAKMTVLSKISSQLWTYYLLSSTQNYLPDHKKISIVSFLRVHSYCHFCLDNAVSNTEIPDYLISVIMFVIASWEKLHVMCYDQFCFLTTCLSNSTLILWELSCWFEPWPGQRSTSKCMHKLCLFIMIIV